MEVSIAAEEVRRFRAAIADSVSAPMRAASRLFLFSAIKAFTAGNGGSPCDAIADSQRIAGPILVEASSKFLNYTNCFVTENDRELDGQLTFPKVNIRAADSRHFHAHKRGSWLRLQRGCEGLKRQRGIETRKDSSATMHAAETSRGSRRGANQSSIG